MVYHGDPIYILYLYDHVHVFGWDANYVTLHIMILAHEPNSV